MRKVSIVAKKPENMNIEISAGDPGGPMEHISTIPVTILVCDLCNEAIPDGSPAVAVTMWRSDQEETPGNWEEEYTA